MIKVIKVTDEAALKQALTIRDIVFVQEQGCPSDLEHENDDIAVHFLAAINGIPAGAARWRRTDAGFKLERFAVLPAFRGKGIATAMISAVLADLPADAAYIYLHAQVDAVPVYEQNGFVKSGDSFEEAGIWHYKMTRLQA
ncbi:GNAT family N-acetyltransferase [Taibaiella koreensis]|uniref:GNAT family N-acetyltransferase n=1 Tax=Taibaiella koreensis TaxID=1268548 RepID=UPI000E59C618|nr:GNAT family N-acetyltransferase [Taibaiella koreensis]